MGPVASPPLPASKGLLCLLAVAGAIAFTGPAEIAAVERPGAEGSTGERLYLRDCASCHGPRGEGSPRGTPLTATGAAGADFMLATGRMPLVTDEVRRRPSYDAEERAALVQYVASLGTGPAVPELRPARADLAGGGLLYRQYCAPCHGTTGAGTALAFGAIAPPIADVPGVQVAEAAIIGPGTMPPFSPAVLAEEELNDLVAYVAAVAGDPVPAPLEMGGARLGEAAVALGLGLAALVLAATVVAGRR